MAYPDLSSNDEVSSRKLRELAVAIDASIESARVEMARLQQEKRDQEWAQQEALAQERLESKRKRQAEIQAMPRLKRSWYQHRSLFIATVIVIFSLMSLTTYNLVNKAHMEKLTSKYSSILTCDDALKLDYIFSSIHGNRAYLMSSSDLEVIHQVNARLVEQDFRSVYQDYAEAISKEKGKSIDLLAADTLMETLSLLDATSAGERIDGTARKWSILSAIAGLDVLIKSNSCNALVS